MASTRTLRHNGIGGTYPTTALKSRVHSAREASRTRRRGTPSTLASQRMSRRSVEGTSSSTQAPRVAIARTLLRRVRADSLSTWLSTWLSTRLSSSSHTTPPSLPAPAKRVAEEGGSTMTQRELTSTSPC
eukprot:2645502-Pleurochrysis_carterae.AAC.2